MSCSGVSVDNAASVVGDVSFFRFFLGSFAKCKSKCVTELHNAPNICKLHPYAECNAYPCIRVSNTIFMVRMITNIPNTPAVADPNVTKPFHI